jgi:PST family polysaccharide transporter
VNAPLQGRATAVSGMSWIFVASVVARATGLLAQVLIGWLLLPEDFGVYALALGISTFTAALRNGALLPILIRRGAEFPTLARTGFDFALRFNLLAMALLGVLGLVLLLRGQQAGAILFGMALAMPLCTPTLLHRAKLTIDGRFAALAAVDLGASVGWQLSVIGLALLGYGPLSFIAAPVVQTLVEWWSSGRLSGLKIRSLPREAAPDYRRLLADAKWGMLGTTALCLAVSGDYFAVAVLADARTAGLYLFAFQLVAAVATPARGAIESVLPAVLNQAGDDRARQGEVMRRTLVSILLLGIPVAMTLVLLAPALLELVWRGRWSDAAPAVAILFACAPAWVVLAVLQSQLEACGHWRARFLLLALYGIGGMSVAAAVAANGGDVTALATAVTVFYVVFVAAALFLLARSMPGLALSPGRTLLPVVAVHLTVFAVSWLLAQRVWPGSDWRGPFAVLLLLPAMLLVNRGVFQRPWRDLENQVIAQLAHGGLVGTLARRLRPGSGA